MKVIRKKYFDMPTKVKQATEIWLESAGIVVVGQAKALAPVDTGRLKNSLSWATNTAQEGDISNPKALNTCVVGTNVEYAPYMEYGTVRIPSGRPFLRPALRVMKPRLKTNWRKAMREAHG